mgnify:CR=1 FL=1
MIIKYSHLYDQVLEIVQVFLALKEMLIKRIDSQYISITNKLNNSGNYSSENPLQRIESEKRRKLDLSLQSKLKALKEKLEKGFNINDRLLVDTNLKKIQEFQKHIFDFYKLCEAYGLKDHRVNYLLRLSNGLDYLWSYDFKDSFDIISTTIDRHPNDVQVSPNTIRCSSVEIMPDNYVRCIFPFKLDISSLGYRSGLKLNDNDFRIQIAESAHWKPVLYTVIYVKGEKGIFRRFINYVANYFRHYDSLLTVLKKLTGNEDSIQEKTLVCKIDQHSGGKQFLTISNFRSHDFGYIIKDLSDLIAQYDSNLYKYIKVGDNIISIEKPIYNYQLTNTEEAQLRDNEDAKNKLRKKKYLSFYGNFARLLYSFARKLNQSFKYVKNDGIGLMESIKDFILLSESEVSEKAGNLVLSPIVVADKIASNSIEPVLAERYKDKELSEVLVEVSSGSEKFDPHLPYGSDNWLGAFNKSGISSENQRKIHQEGIQFLISKQSTILADEPGMGKTSQAILAAELTRESHQKILVITPNSLVDSNWAGDLANGPQKFLGHNRDQICIVMNKDDLQSSMADSNIIWIVVPESRFNQPQLSKVLKRFGDRGQFSTVIIDEIQQYKNINSALYKNIESSISRNIVRRIGLSGTPSDNVPSDIYAQLRLILHPLAVYEKKSAGISKQDSDAFIQQFLGGQELSNIVSYSKNHDLNEEYYNRCYNSLKWVSELSEKDKENILKLYSSTFLRRNKSEIRDIPLITKQFDAKEIDDGQGNISGADWKQKIRRRNADMKAAYTVKQAVALLNADPNRQIFIASFFIDTVEKIANEINNNVALLPELRGKTIAYGITSKISENNRSLIVNRFKAKNSDIRVLVYTLDTGAVGLNFSNCDCAIINDLSDNPSVNIQAQYRVHRLDSEKPVTIYYPRIIGNSQAAIYDNFCYKRIQIKQKINEEINKIISQTQRASFINPNDVNTFVCAMVEGIVSEADLDEYIELFILDNIERLKEGQPLYNEEKFKQYKFVNILSKNWNYGINLLEDYFKYKLGISSSNVYDTLLNVEYDSFMDISEEIRDIIYACYNFTVSSSPFINLKMPQREVEVILENQAQAYLKQKFNNIIKSKIRYIIWNKHEDKNDISIMDVDIRSANDRASIYKELLEKDNMLVKMCQKYCSEFMQDYFSITKAANWYRYLKIIQSTLL